MTDHEDEMTQAERIRWLMHRCDTREDEIADLQERLNATTDQVRVQHIDIATLKAERDEARRELCEEWVMRGRTYTLPNGHKFTPSAKDWATIANWDCFRESPLDRLAKMDEENGL